MRIAAILVAAGSGSRFGGETPKQFHPSGGQAGHPARRRGAAAPCDVLQPVGERSRSSRRSPAEHAARRARRHHPQASVAAGLEALVPYAPDLVLIHDAARPFLPPETIPALLAALRTHDGAIPAGPGRGHAEAGAERTNRDHGAAGRPVPRPDPAGLPLPAAPRAPRDQGRSATDDASLLEAAGHPVAIVAGSDDNIKLTYAEDRVRLERALLPSLSPRIGTGFDVHAMEAGRPLILCGITVPHEQGLAATPMPTLAFMPCATRSMGRWPRVDIGRHFPPSEATWKDADSARSWSTPPERIAARGGRAGQRRRDADLRAAQDHPPRPPP